MVSMIMQLDNVPETFLTLKEERNILAFDERKEKLIYKSEKLLVQTRLHFRMVDAIHKNRVTKSSWKENFRMSRVSFYELYRKSFGKKENTVVFTKCFSFCLCKFFERINDKFYTHKQDIFYKLACEHQKTAK